MIWNKRAYTLKSCSKLYMPYSFDWPLYFACRERGRNILWLIYRDWEQAKHGIDMAWHIQLNIKFSFLWPLVWDQLYTNFHCTKISKFENDNVINIPTPLFVYFRNWPGSTYNFWRTRTDLTSPCLWATCHKTCHTKITRPSCSTA